LDSQKDGALLGENFSQKDGALLGGNFLGENRKHFLYTTNNHLIMETIRSLGEGAVTQYLSTVPCVEYLILCHDEQKLDISPAVYNIKFGEESAIVGAKRKLKKEKRRQPIALFSATHGHLDCQNSNCPICVRKMGNKVKLQPIPNCSMKERKRGFRWRLETCTSDQRNFEGEKDAFILRDSASDALEIMHAIYRNDSLLQFKQWANKIRSALANLGGVLYEGRTIIGHDYYRAEGGGGTQAGHH
jgi:hypothetical protein